MTVISAAVACVSGCRLVVVGVGGVVESYLRRRNRVLLLLSNRKLTSFLTR